MPPVLFSQPDSASAALLQPPTGQPTPPALPLLLASRSPRRRELLRAHGFAHEVTTPGFEDGELEPGDASPRQWVAALATLKAWAGAREAAAWQQGGRVVLGADTACLLDGTLVGTPTSHQQAGAMLRAFAQRSHDVLTGVAIIDLRGLQLDSRALVSDAALMAAVPARRRRVFVDVATVTVGPLTDAQVDEYVATEAWKGKAGGYNFAERVDAGWPLAAMGDHATIMGLPMNKLAPLLRSMAQPLD